MCIRDSGQGGQAAALHLAAHGGVGRHAGHVEQHESQERNRLQHRGEHRVQGSEEIQQQMKELGVEMEIVPLILILPFPSSTIRVSIWTGHYTIEAPE